MPKDIGITLKNFRSAAKMSVKEISDILTNKGFKASESTIYSWENGNSQPTPGALLTMCTAYGINDVLSAFGYDGYNEDGSIFLNNRETSMIEKYRSLDPYGQETVNIILDREVKRAETTSERELSITELEEISPPLYIISYYQRLASAGNGEYLFDDIPTETMEVPANEMSEQADFVIGVNGNSMEPTYHDGDKVYVEKMEEIPVGSIGIFTRGPECFIKELGNDRLISHNKEYADIPASDDIRCVGLVLGKVEEA